MLNEATTGTKTAARNAPLLLMRRYLASLEPALDALPAANGVEAVVLNFPRESDAPAAKPVNTKADNSEFKSVMGIPALPAPTGV